MKRETIVLTPRGRGSDDGGSADMSAETALRREIAELSVWLAAQGLDLRGDRSHSDQGSRDQLYWRYGYFVGLQQALAALTSGGATLH